jgi:putative acetyltransferase
MAVPLTIRTDDLTGSAIQALLELHAAGMLAASPLGSCHYLDLDGLRAPEVTVWTAWARTESGDEALAGCVALREIDAAHGEVKSMRTAPDHLGQGVGAALLDHTLDVARTRGYTRVSLETGSTEPFAAAIHLYERFGFVPCGPFADYGEDPFSRFFTLDLSPLGGFVGRCRSWLGAPDVAERVAEAVRTLVADPASRTDVSGAVERLRPQPGAAAVIHRSDELTVLGLEVAAGFVSPAHEHRLWSVVGIYEGAEDNVFYRRTRDGIEETGRAVVRAGEAVALPADAVHRITNSGAEPLRALHVYGGDLFATARSEWDDATGAERPFGSSRAAR